jgi:hypothetical protein
VDQRDSTRHAVSARLGGSESEKAKACAGWCTAQHAVFEHAKDQRGTASVPVAIAVQIGALEVAADLADFVEDHVDVLAHQLTCLGKSRYQTSVGHVHEVTEDVHRTTAFPAGRHFDPRDHLEAWRRGGLRFGNA